jgi:hypothetical protein
MGQLNPEDYRRIRRPVLLKAGLNPAVVDYLLELERLDPPAAASSLEDLSNQPRWDGKRVLLAGTNRELVYREGRWTFA